jgi:hypothetical protein
MCRPHREQAHSHIGLHSSGPLGQLWERACPRWRSVRRRDIECAGLIASRLTPTLDCILADYSINCGSEPARDGGVSDAAILNVPAPSRASPLPQGFGVWTYFVSTTAYSGSEPARDGGVSDAAILNVPAPSRASPLPQGFRVYTYFVSTTVTCGSELARDGGVSGAAILNLLSPSRAGSLPHWTASLRTTRSTVGASLLAMAECQTPRY